MKRSDTDGFATFVASDLHLRRGAQWIWSNASWNVHGFTALVGGMGRGKVPPSQCWQVKSRQTAEP